LGNGDAPASLGALGWRRFTALLVKDIMAFLVNKRLGVTRVFCRFDGLWVPVKI
jgi:hypothetical protein